MGCICFMYNSGQFDELAVCSKALLWTKHILILTAHRPRKHARREMRAAGKNEAGESPKYMLVMRNLNKRQYRRKLPCSTN